MKEYNTKYTGFRLQSVRLQRAPDYSEQISLNQKKLTAMLKSSVTVRTFL